MTDIEITPEYIKTGLREEIEEFTKTALANMDPTQFQRKGRLSQITAADLITLEMDETLSDIEEDPLNSGSAIERLAYLHFARMVAARIASGAVLGSRAEAMAEPVKPKAVRKSKAKKDAEEKAAEPTPPVTEPEVEPAPVVEVLESDQTFLTEQAEAEEAAANDTDVEPEAETPVEEVTPEEVPTLTKADNSVLDLL